MTRWTFELLLCGALAGAMSLLRRAWSERARLRQRLDVSSQELERLQRSFARFAPEHVIERIIAAGISTSAEKKASSPKRVGRFWAF